MTTIEFYEHLAQIKREAQATAFVRPAVKEDACDRVIRMRKEDPKGYALVRIDICFQDTEAKAREIRKKGKTAELYDDFRYLLCNLKSVMKRMKETYGLTNSEINEFCEKRGYSPKLQFNLSPAK